MADLCTFDSTLTTFDSTARTWDQTTCQQVQEAPQAVGGGRMPRRRRYLLPDGTLVYATLGEIQELLQPFVEAEETKPRPKVRKRAREVVEPFKAESWEPVRFELVKDSAEETYKALVDLKLTRRLKAEMSRRAQELKRRIDDEEALFLLF